MHLLNLLVLLRHDVLAELADRVHDELAERAAQRLAVEGGRIRPDGLALRVLAEVVVTPEALHHLRELDAELLTVDAREGLNREGPLVQAGPSRQSTTTNAPSVTRRAAVTSDEKS